MDLTRWLQRPPVLPELPDEVAAVVTGSRPSSATGSRHADTQGWDADARPHLATSGRRPAASSRISARRHLAARPRKKGEREKGGRRRESTGGVSGMFGCFVPSLRCHSQKKQHTVLVGYSTAKIRAADQSQE
uniref:Uncharacterized protein n=1 Tax=Oryza sativa subsp. japonica TaxID=39947 RepID=Q69LV6_ORYSJ|nr:hypothetical protein [Oryza sativa Japonica Group]